MVRKMPKCGCGLRGDHELSIGCVEAQRNRLLKIAKKVLAATSPVPSHHPASAIVARMHQLDNALADLREAVEEVERND